MLGFYVIMALFTGGYLAKLNQPSGAGEVIACVGMALGWPLLVLMLLAHGIRRSLRAASGTLTEGGDAKQAPGDSLGGPAPERGDAQGTHP
jgi:hypothetical protein